MTFHVYSILSLPAERIFPYIQSRFGESATAGDMAHAHLVNDVRPTDGEAVAADLDGRLARLEGLEERVAAVCGAVAGRIAFATSLGLEDQAVLHAIGQIAADAHVKKLVLSHRMLRTLGKESQTQAEIRKRYWGPLEFANVLDCFPVK